MRPWSRWHAFRRASGARERDDLSQACAPPLCPAPQGYFHRSQRVAHAHSRRWELEMTNGPFEEDGLYTWVYEGSKTKLYLLTGLLLLGAPRRCLPGL